MARKYAHKCEICGVILFVSDDPFDTTEYFCSLHKPLRDGIATNDGVPTSSGIELIAAERTEQIEKHGFSVSHDQSENSTGDKLLLAATHCIDAFTMTWPWDDTRSPVEKGYCRIHQLKVAGALIAAEIDRLIANGAIDFEGLEK